MRTLAAAPRRRARLMRDLLARGQRSILRRVGGAPIQIALD